MYESLRAEGGDRSLTADEERGFLLPSASFKIRFFGLIVRCAIETECVQSEITNLRRSQVDIQRRIVTLSATKWRASRGAAHMRDGSLSGKALEHPYRPIDTDLFSLVTGH